MNNTRSSLYRKHPFSFFLLAITLLILTSFVAACGTKSSTTTGSSGSATATPIPVSTVTSIPTPPTVQGYGTSQGCPSDAVVNTAPPTANVIVKPSQAKGPVTASVGNVIEIDLPFGHKWVGPTSSTGNLTLQQPSGYAWKAGNVCVWRFTAQSAGTTPLMFTEQAICNKGQVCPMYIVNVTFQITVK